MSSPGASAVRPATDADVPAVVETLGRAFEHYSWSRHAFAADRYRERLDGFHRLFLEHVGLPHGRVWVAADGAAAALWTTPESTAADDALAGLTSRFADLAGDRAPQMRAALAAMAPHRPTEPVWFLALVGVHPDHQGHGLARAVLTPGLDAARHAGVPAFLETSEARNVALYQHLGFTVTAEYDIPDGGPRSWAMLRDPHA